MRPGYDALGRLKTPTTGTVTQPKGVGTGVGLQSSASGAPQAFVNPGFAPGVSLAPGWGINYQDGRPVAFQAPAAGGAPSVAQALGAGAPAPGAAPGQADQAPDPRDAAYASGATRLLFDNQHQRSAIDQQGQYDQQDLASVVARMAQARAKDLLATNHAANRQGLFYSGQLGARRSAVEGDYNQRQGDAQLAADRRAAARRSALDELGVVSADPNSPLGYSGTGRAGLDLGDLYNAAVDRQTYANQSLAYPEDPAPADPAHAPQLPAGVTAAPGVSVAPGWSVVRDPVTGQLKFVRG